MKKKFKKGMTISFVLTCLFVLFGLVAEADPVEQRLERDMTINSETANKLKNILIEVGIDSYDTIIHDPLLDNAHNLNEKGYRMNTKNVDNVIVYMKEDISFFKVKYANNVLFAGNKTLGNINDVTLSDEDKANLKISTMETVKGLLAFPDTASFPLVDGWKYGIIEGESVVQGYVESENAFKQTLKTEFQAKYKAGVLISLIVGDKEYVKK